MFVKIKSSILNVWIYNVCFVSKKLYMVYRCIINIVVLLC